MKQRQYRTRLTLNFLPQINHLRWFTPTNRRVWRGRVLAGVIVGLLLTAFALCWPNLPQPLFTAPYSSLLLSRDGQLLGANLAADGQWRFPLRPAVPDKFTRALLRYEDQRFFSHGGVDGWALARALFLNLSQGRVVSGASTLSMQVIRLARAPQPRNYWEKALEIGLALRLEQGHSKSEILALYAAYAPFGGNVVGLEAAAWRYFGRDPAQLSWAEACTLAVLPNSPALVHPGRNRAQLQAKRDALLQRLYADGALTALDLRLAQLESLPAQPQPLPRLAPHLLDSLRQTTAPAARSLTATPAPDPYRFHTTLDKPLQQAVSQLITQQSQALRQQGIHNAAALVIDNRTFSVLAYVGNSRHDVFDQHGYALDLVHRPRSTGSLLKPFLYALMLQQGEILPDTLVADVPSQYGGYMPENYDRQFRGAVPARAVLAHSLNVPAVRWLSRYGVARFYANLRQLGLHSLHRSPQAYGLSLILGGAEGSLWDLTAMYARLADIANAAQARPDYRQLRVLQTESPSPGTPAELGVASAWLTLDALLAVTRPDHEAYWQQFSSTRKIAWKTGTSFGQRDGWAIGSTPRYTVGVWVGNATGEGRPGLTGVGVAAPILFSLFNRLPDRDWFIEPRSQMKPVRVCRDDGYLANTACSAKTQWIPRDSHFEQVTPFHTVLHLDATGLWQVHSGCAAVSTMQHRAWFILPPNQAFYYRQQHADYQPPPPFRADCQALASADDKPIALLYPPANARLFIPIDLDGRKSRVVLAAIHRDPAAVLYWHLDDQYLGETRVFHQQALDLAEGQHRLVLVDQTGFRLEQNFSVLGQKASGD